MGIPPAQSLVGAVISAQAAPFDPALVGYDLAIGTTDVIDVTIGN